MFSRVYLFFPLRGHEPPLTLHDRVNPYLSLQRRRFTTPRYAKRPNVALYVIGPLFLLPTPSSPHCTLKTSEHNSLWSPPAVLFVQRPPSQKCSRAQGCLNALTQGYLKGTTVVGGHPMDHGLVSCTVRVPTESLDHGHDVCGAQAARNWAEGRSVPLHVLHRPPEGVRHR